MEPPPLVLHFLRPPEAGLKNAPQRVSRDPEERGSLQTRALRAQGHALGARCALATSLGCLYPLQTALRDQVRYRPLCAIRPRIARGGQGCVYDRCKS